jgi:hypothetical protein
MATEYLLVDLENVVPGMISNLLENQSVLIFTGSKQNKLHRDLVVSAQPFGKQIEWIVIGGDGKNAADFHIAYYIGAYSEKEPGASFSILSEDKGYDPLIRHLVSKGITCKRIEDIDEFTKPKKLPRHKKNIDEIAADLETYFIKCDKKTRPKKHAKFMAFVKSRYKLDDDSVLVVKDKMIANKLIEINDDKIMYLVDDLPF